MRLPLALLSLSIALSPSGVAAQADAPSRAAEARARGLFEEGLALAEDGREEEALASFEQAFVLSPRASTAHNIAWVLFSQGRARDAWIALERAAAFPMTDEERAAIDSLRIRLRPLLATLIVRVRPAESVLCIDDVCDASSSDVRTITVDPGASTLRISASGHLSRELALTAVAGTTERIDVSLNALVPSEVARSAVSNEPERARTLERHRRRVRRGVLVSAGVAAAISLVAGLVVGVRRPPPYAGMNFELL